MPAFFEKPLSAITSKWRIFHEESVDLNPRDEKTDHEELRGVKDSRIYRYGQEVLAVSSDSSRLQIKLRDLLGIPRNPKPAPTSHHSRNPSPDAKPTHLPRALTGSVLLFPDVLLDAVAEAIQARKRRQYTPEQLEEARRRVKIMQEGRKVLSKSSVGAPETTITPSVG